MRLSQIRFVALFLLCACAIAQEVNLDTQAKGSRWPAWSVDTGAANAYAVATVAPLGPALKPGSTIEFIATHANTGASTVAVNGGSTIPIKKNVSSALTGGEIPLNGVVVCYYDGTNCQIQSGVLVTGGACGAGDFVNAIAPVTAVPTCGTPSGGGGGGSAASSSQLPINDTSSPVGLAGFWTAKAITLSNGTTYTVPANGTNINYWLDVSGNNNTLTLGGLGSSSCNIVFNTGQTPGGGPALNNAAGCNLTINGPEEIMRYREEITVFAVVKLNNLTGTMANGSYFLSDNTCCGSGPLWYVDTNLHTALQSQAVGLLGNGTATWNTSWHYVNFTCSYGAAPTFRFDGAVDTYVPATPARDCSKIGVFSALGYIASLPGYAACDCQFAEVRIYHRVLSTAERQAVEAIEVASWF